VKENSFDEKTIFSCFLVVSQSFRNLMVFATGNFRHT
jgi:hypothetical protein